MPESIRRAGLRGQARATGSLTGMRFDQLIPLAEQTVARVKKRLPEELRVAAEAVTVICAAEPDESVIAEGLPPDILGLFEGSPYGSELDSPQPMPPHIVLYLLNLWEFAEEDQGVFRDEVKITYLHELGHYFGWDEDEVAARGLD